MSNLSEYFKRKSDINYVFEITQAEHSEIMDKP